MSLSTREKMLILSYIDAVDKFATLCKLCEELPEKHLYVLMQAESLPIMGKRMRDALEIDT